MHVIIQYVHICVWLLMFSIKKSHILSNISKEDDFIYCIIQNTSWPFYLENTLNKALRLVSSLIILWQRLLQLYGLLITVSSEVKVSSELKKIPHQKMFQHFPYMMVKYPHGRDSLLLMLHISWPFVMLEATRSLFLTWLLWVCLGRYLVKTAKQEKSGFGAFLMTLLVYSLSHVGCTYLSYPSNLPLSFPPRPVFHIFPCQQNLPLQGLISPGTAVS